MSELPLEGRPGTSVGPHDTAQGHVICLTEDGERLAAIVPAEYAAALEGITPIRHGNCPEDLADGAAARRALDEPGEDILPGRPGRAWPDVTGPVGRGQPDRGGYCACALAGDRAHRVHRSSGSGRPTPSPPGNARKRRFCRSTGAPPGTRTPNPRIKSLPKPSSSRFTRARCTAQGHGAYWYERGCTCMNCN